MNKHLFNYLMNEHAFKDDIERENLMAEILDHDE